jgi:hypothetical protein
VNGSADFVKELAAQLRGSKKLDSEVVAVMVERLLESETPKKKADDVFTALQTLAYKRAAK